jgi:hypothetical protein
MRMSNYNNRQEVKIFKKPLIQESEIKEVLNNCDFVKKIADDNNSPVIIFSSSDTDYISCDIQLKKEKYQEKGFEYFRSLQFAEY